MAYLLSQLLSNAAARFPEKTAVTCTGSTLCYRSLEQQSNRLARLLCREGVQPGDRVALYLNKSVETVLGIFAILKAGAAYVPLDPMGPPQRLGLILQNCGVRHFLTTAAKANVLSAEQLGQWGVELGLLMDELPVSVADGGAIRWRQRRDADAESCELPDNPVIESDLAYILYTSGSTGVPKGVMISHRNALTFINWASDCFGIRAEDQFSNHAPFHFDLSVFDLFVSIKHGATLHLVPELAAFFPANLIRFVEANQISIWYSVPSVLTLLSQHASLETRQLSHLRLILFAGEVFPTKHLRSLMQALPQPRYFNLYGPTETNVCTYYEVPSPPADDAPIPIGKACANTEVFALNERGARSGVGEKGILFVRGPTVMKGYWGLPLRTAEVVSAWTDASGHAERIYRTGDVVVLGYDGYYRFLGRRDHMVKSRGYRIELGEVEAALHSHPAVEEAVVVAVPDEEVGHRLKALVVARRDGNVSATELVRHCSQRIPKYMIPESIDLRAHLPKTSTGKIDRQQLLRDLLPGPVATN